MGNHEPVKLTANATETLRRRYLRRDESGRIVEAPEDLFHRVARCVASAERGFNAAADIEAIERRFFEAMARTEFLPNSPTLMNAGRTGGLLSACFVLPVDDSVEGIFESVKRAAMIQKAGGGTGFSFDRLRPTGDYIAGSGGKTSGLMSFWRVFAEATRAIQQGASRRGANMGMLSVTHPDILKFITAKSAAGEFENFNISVKVTDEFMSALADRPDEPHVVRNPRTGSRHWLPRGLAIDHYELADLPRARPAEAPPGEVFSRRDVWQRIVHEAWSTGEPGLCFIDRVNEANPTPSLGAIEATNPCGEQPLLDNEACNLGSIDLAKFVRGGAFDEEAFRRAVRLGVRFLDNVVEVNHYVAPEIDDVCRGNRKVGLGVMGLADALFELGIAYDSEEAIAFGRRTARLLATEATEASEALARRRGTFANFAGSVWEARGRAVRNAAITTVAPTGTLSILAGTTGGIEPAFALAFYRHVLDGAELVEVDGPFRRFAQRQGIWSEDLARLLAAGADVADVAGIAPERARVFVTARRIAPSWHIRMQAAFQEHVDGAISKTVNLPAGASEADVDAACRLAHELGCKGVTIYRDGCRGGEPMGHESTGANCPRCRGPLDADDGGCSRCPSCGATLCS